MYFNSFRFEIKPKSTYRLHIPRMVTHTIRMFAIPKLNTHRWDGKEALFQLTWFSTRRCPHEISWKMDDKINNLPFVQAVILVSYPCTIRTQCARTNGKLIKTTHIWRWTQPAHRQTDRHTYTFINTVFEHWTTVLRFRQIQFDFILQRQSTVQCTWCTIHSMNILKHFQINQCSHFARSNIPTCFPMWQ